MKPERLRELAERLAKAMPERFKFLTPNLSWWLDDGQLSYDDETALWLWWGLVGPLLDELGVEPDTVARNAYYTTTCAEDSFSGVGIKRYRVSWLESAFVAVVEAAEAKR